MSDIEFIAKEIILLKDGKLISHNTCNSLTKEIENKVFEVETEKENLKYFQENYRVSNLFHSGDKITVRIVTDNAHQNPYHLHLRIYTSMCLKVKIKFNSTSF